ncbi:MAG: hypothetical protein JNK82_09605 [Myxococcaceae bacterium]|nr:hypothetical protein [Myxococcaceae bacterium]
MFHVTIGSVSQHTLTLRLEGGRPPKAASFPINLLIELWSMLDAGAPKDRALAHEKPWGPAMRELKSLAHGAEEELTKLEYDALRTRGQLPRRLSGQTALSWGKVEDRYTVGIAGDRLGFIRVCARLVASYEQRAVGKQTLVKVTVNDPQLLGFVHAGTEVDCLSSW